jgi:N-acetylmuramoyl-L-alanine amidase
MKPPARQPNIARLAKSALALATEESTTTFAISEGVLYAIANTILFCWKWTHPNYFTEIEECQSRSIPCFHQFPQGNSPFFDEYTVSLEDSPLPNQVYQRKELQLLNTRTNSNSKYILTVALLAALILVASAAGAAATAYRVAQGDSLFLIARRYGVTVGAIRTANGLVSDIIYPGQILTIPDQASSNPPNGQSGTAYTVRSGDSLFLIAQRHGIAVSALKATNGLLSDWIYPGQALTIPSKGSVSPSPGGAGSLPSSGAWNQSDIRLLAQLVTAEAGGEPHEGQVAVAATVLNRVNSHLYPNTISGVIFQVIDGRYYQFSPVLDGRIHNAPSSAALDAPRKALNGWDPSYGALGFYNPSKTSNYWVRSRIVTRVIGDHIFFK